LQFPLAFLLVACLFLWPLVLHPGFIPVRPGGQESDLLLSHLPNAAYLRSSLARYGQWPLWNAQILAGEPFAANPLSGMWYPPNLLLALPDLPLPVVLNLLFILHVTWAGYGVFRLLRAEGLPDGTAFLGGLAFAGTPKLIAHLAAGHVSLVFAVAWTPWLLLVVRNMATRPGARTGALVGVVMAGMFLAGVIWPAYVGLLAGAYGLTTWAAGRSPSMQPRPPFKALLWSGGVATAFFLLLSAVLLLPFVELIAYSARSALGMQDAAIYSLPPFPYLLGLLVPLRGVIHEWVTYAGLAPLGLALAGVGRRPFWAAAGVTAGIFALGSNSFLFPLVFRWLPGLNMLRVPSRAWFIVALAVCLLAAHGWQLVVTRWGAPLRPLRYARLGLPVLLVVTSVDLLWMNSSLLEARPMLAPSPAATWLAARPGLFRVYSSSASLPLPDTLQHVEGVDPLHLAALADFVARATQISGHAYCVSVPAIFSSDPASTPPPSALLLGLLNVRYVVSDFDVAAPGLRLVQQFAATRIYENSLAQPRAWLAGGAAAEVEEWSPDRIVVRAAGPGLLILSEVAYPGWEARIDWKRVPIETVDGLLRGVRVGPGMQAVEFRFRPQPVFAGGLLTIIGLCALLGPWRWTK
jgi:hypothetical protein